MSTRIWAISELPYKDDEDRLLGFRKMEDRCTLDTSGEEGYPTEGGWKYDPEPTQSVLE